MWSKRQSKTFLKGCNKKKKKNCVFSLPTLNKEYFCNQKCVKFFSQPTVPHNSAEFWYYLEMSDPQAEGWVPQILPTLNDNSLGLWPNGQRAGFKLFSAPPPPRPIDLINLLQWLTGFRKYCLCFLVYLKDKEEQPNVEMPQGSYAPLSALPPPSPPTPPPHQPLHVFSNLEAPQRSVCVYITIILYWPPIPRVWPLPLSHLAFPGISLLSKTMEEHPPPRVMSLDKLRYLSKGLALRKKVTPIFE